MSFEKLLRIPTERVGALIGKSGNVKIEIESTCCVKLDIDGNTGEIFIKTAEYVEKMQPFKAVEIVTAIGRGFSPQNAMQLLKGDNTLHVMDLSEFGGKSRNQIERIKGRIIGEGGKARKNMENLSGSIICVYGKTVSVIGSTKNLKLAVDAINSISNGSMHGSVYSKMEAARRRAKIERMQLWEDQNVF